MKRVEIRMQDDEYETLKRKAYVKGMTLSSFIRWAIRNDTTGTYSSHLVFREVIKEGKE